MHRKSIFSGLALLVLMATALTACPPSTVIRNGKKVTVEEASKADLSTAKALEKEGKVDEAIAKFEAFIKEFPNSDLVDDALAEEGKLLAKKGEHEKAVVVLQHLVGDYPDSPHYLNAVLQLGLSLAKLGRISEALPTLQSVFDQLPNQKRKVEVAGLLASSYEQADVPVEAIRWYSLVYQLSADRATKEAVQAKLTSIIDEKLSFIQVRQALETLKEKDPKSFPLDLLSFKLAKIYFHIYDFPRAQAELEKFVAQWPEHSLAQQAGKLLKRIIDRNKVEPTAIGVLLPLTGKFRAYGQKALSGIQLGAGIFKDPKPGEPAPVLIIRDTAGDPDLAAKHVNDLVYNEHVAAVIGPIFSAEAYSAAVRAQQLQVPIISLSLREDIPSVGDYVFRNFLTLAAQAKILVSYAMDHLGVKKFALLYPNDKYGVGFVNAFWDEVKKRKGEIRAAERYEPDAKNFAAPIKKMVGRYWLDARWDFALKKRKIREKFKNNPLARKRAIEKLLKSIRPLVDFQAIFIPDYHEKIAMIAPALAFEDIVIHTDSQWKIERIKKSLGRDKLDMVYLMGGNGWDNPQLIEWADRYVQGAIFCDGFFANSDRLATRHFVQEFKANFNTDPDWVEAHAYDTAAIVKQIVQKAKPRTRDAFRKALLNIKNFDGATGKTSFEANGEASKDLFLLTIKKDQIEEIKPESTDNAGS